ncbi:hypothetical protein Elgi_36770 [Paenibacillus elgii]|uniref:hypothetical protein n=1 Tax=Paenibacillus elgii TaxID=189691 RepID=UPI002D7C5BF8|nr:hypothetical protein Elgi_36770 [Paenibacillus elgii]
MVQLVQAEFDLVLPNVRPKAPEQLVIEHKNKTYTITDKVVMAKQNQIKQFDISDINKQYIESFRNYKWPNYETDKQQKASWLQYKSSVGNLLETVGKDAAIIKRADVELFLSKFNNKVTKSNKAAHIKSFLSYIVKHNVANCNTRVSRETLIMVISL